MNRRHLLAMLAASSFAALPLRAEPRRLVVAKSPSCGCCNAWVQHMRRAGFAVETRDMEQDSLYGLKASFGITPDHASCHTAVIDGYVIEGHVPAEDVLRLLAERPSALGLAVPGMPIGSPGMEMGNEREPFDTLLIYASGDAQIFASHH